MTSRRPSLTRSSVARRGVLLGSPALLLAGCGLLPSGAEAEAPEAADDGTADAPERAEESAADPATSAVLDLTAVEVEDEVVAGGLMKRLETTETLLHPHAAISVTATALLDSLTAEQYTALTGEDAPLPEGADPSDDGPPATTLLPGEMKAFLLASWESTDPKWRPTTSSDLTSLHIAHGGNDEIYLDFVEKGDRERSGTVLAIVDASPDPSAVTVRAVIDDGAQDISLIDGSIVATIAPRLYTGSLDVEVSEAGVFEADIRDGFGAETMHVRGTVDSAFLTPFISHSGLTWGGYLGWTAEDEIYAVVQLDWEKDYSANVTELGEIVLVLPDGTEVTPVQEERYIFDHHADNVATFVMPARTETATVRITPRFQMALDDDFDETHDPITARLTVG